MAKSAISDDHPLDMMLAVSDLLQSERLASLYARVFEHGSPTVEELADGVDISQTTVYEDVHHLVEVGALERVTEKQPHRYQIRQVDVNVTVGDESVQITPTLLVALGDRDSNENVDVYLDRHGISGLATAVEYARAYVQDRMNARIMAREQDITVLEAETVLQELQEIIHEVEPDLPSTVDMDELDAAVDEP
ncbi:DeoR family transcriptional regulator [Halosimplex pelagicum]|uniref:DeoR family transcriptional regulator n=2 Tax=Halosimplex pelagicum TaxID=869886 RepID=A0A7D5PCG4_9EURY|nr:DeoR family transcriptional regulator [Halosimplex pelagicum]